MKPLHQNIDKIINALKEIINSDHIYDSKTRHEARSIVDKIDFIFLCCTIVWYDVLSKMNIASQVLQSVSANVQSAMISLQNQLTFLQDYEQTDLMKAIERAKEMAGDIEPNFDDSRRLTSARLYVYRTSRIEPHLKHSRMNLFIISLNEFNDLFSFLYDFKNFDVTNCKIHV